MFAVEYEPARVENIIRSIYDSQSSPSDIKAAQNELQALQKLDGGWELGKTLFNFDDARAQFLGAVTFAVKLNQEASQIPADFRQHLLLLLAKGRFDLQPFVTRKLLSVTFLLYLRTYDEWESCIPDVARVLDPRLDYTLLFLQLFIEDFQQYRSALPKLRGHIEKSLPSACQILEIAFQKNDTSLTLAALDAFSPWANVFFDQMSFFLQSIIGLMFNADQEVLDKIADVLSDLLATNAESWPRSYYSLLGTTIVQMTERRNPTERISLGHLAIAVSQHDPTNQQILLPFIFSLTDISEDVVSDVLSREVLEFWISLAEELVSSGLSTSQNDLLLRVIMSYWNRLKLENCDKSSWNEFTSFRNDFSELLEIVYPMLGSKLFTDFVQNITMELQNAELQGIVGWSNIEVSLSCLCGLADVVSYRSDELAALDSLFRSDLFGKLFSCSDSRVCQSAINFLGAYDDLFNQPGYEKYITSTVNYLFECLKQTPLQTSASRSIQKLCGIANEEFAANCSSLLDIYSRLNRNLIPVAHTRTTSGIASLIQKLPDTENKAKLLRVLFSLVESSNQQPLDVYNCIANIGKRFRYPKENVSLSVQQAALEFWSKDPEGLQNHLLLLINEQIGTSMPDFCEILCEIFKAGLAERVLNPFVFAPEIIFNFIEAKVRIGPSNCMPAVVNLACFLVSSRKAEGGLSMQQIHLLLGIISVNAHSESLELLEFICSSSPGSFMQCPNVDKVLEFAVSSLSSGDRFVIRAASKFWVTYIGVEAFKTSIEVLGLSLVQAIAAQLAGNSNRSDVDFYAEILKKLIQVQPRFCSKWLQYVFVDNPDGRTLKSLDASVRTTFVNQLCILRGNRQTNKTVLKFWLLCHGIPEY